MAHTKDANYVFIVEANGGPLEANRWVDLFSQQQYQPTEFCSYDPEEKGRRHVTTGALQKQQYAASIRKALDEDLLFFHRDFFVSDGTDPQLMKVKLFEQLRLFRKEIVPPKNNDYGEVKQYITGKSHGKRDDCVMTLGITRFWSGFMRLYNVQFKQRAVDNGWLLD